MGRHSQQPQALWLVAATAFAVGALLGAILTLAAATPSVVEPGQLASADTIASGPVFGPQLAQPAPTVAQNDTPRAHTRPNVATTHGGTAKHTATTHTAERKHHHHKHGKHKQHKERHTKWT